MQKRLELSVPQGQVPDRLDVLLSLLAPDLSRRKAKKLIAQGSVYVDGKRVQVASRTVRAGASIRVEQTEVADPGAIDLAVIFRDDQVVVVNKPSQVPTDPTRQAATGSLAHALRGHLGLSGRDSLAAVHRLDVETSGAVVFALKKAVAAELSAEFASRAAQRDYLALVEGAPDWDAQQITAPLGRFDAAGTRQVEEGGQEAITDAAVLARGEGRSLLLVSPRTGRTHQIRLHLAFSGHPIAGDRRYGQGAGRVFGLHALGLELRYGEGTLKVLAPPSEAFVEACLSAAIPAATIEDVVDRRRP